MPSQEQSLKLPSPVGFLEALHASLPPTGNGDKHRGGVVLLHPHPLYGGNMRNKVLHQCQKVCASLGLATLRFNFRGVGSSSGTYDDGQGEQRDVIAAIEFMQQRLQALPLYLVGFSFGAWLALKIGAESDSIAGLVGLGTPVGWAELDFLKHSDKPKLFIHGTADQYCEPGELERCFGLMAEPKRLFWVENADHFFTDELEPVAEILKEQFPFRSD
jgi:alpha/beta superfamily hydrolase